MRGPHRQARHEDGYDDPHLVIDRAAQDLEGQQQDHFQGGGRKARSEQHQCAAPQPEEVKAEQHQQPRLQQAEPDVELTHPVAQVVVVKDGAEVLVHRRRLGRGAGEVRHPVGRQHGRRGSGG